MLSSEGKWRLFSDVRTLLCDDYCFGHWPLYKFQYSFLLHGCLVFLWYLFTTLEGDIMATMKHQDLNFALTWNLFLFHIQVGCYFLADAVRLIQIEFTLCSEWGRGGKGNDTKKGRRGSEMLMVLFLFFDTKMESFKCQYFRALATNSSVCWVSFI